MKNVEQIEQRYETLQDEDERAQLLLRVEGKTRKVTYRGGPMQGNFEIKIRRSTLIPSRSLRTYLPDFPEATHLYDIVEMSEDTTLCVYLYSGTERTYNRNGNDTWAEYYRELCGLARQPVPDEIPKLQPMPF